MAGNNGSKKFRKFDHSEAIGSHVNRLNDLITNGLQNSDHNDFDLYFSQVVMGLMALDGMLQPFKDEDFTEVFDDVKQLTKKNRWEKLEFVKKAYKQYTVLMYRQGLFYIQKTGRKNL